MILITGSNGQLGSELKLILNESEAIFGERNTCDITNNEQLETVIVDNKIKTIINCAAYTNVELAEKEKIKAFQVNEVGVTNLALLAKKYSIKLIHISTDYVFNGKSNLPLSETDSTSPVTQYGKSKLAGENAILEISPTALIIRTSWLYSNYGNNFVKTIIKNASTKDSLNIVFDQIGTPTYALDLAKVLIDIIPKIKLGSCEIIHYSNEGAISWYDFAKAICEIKKFTCKINPIESFEFPTSAPRPAYSVLNKRKIKEVYNVSIPYWKESLKLCLENQF